jgi:hypothetical protein
MLSGLAQATAQPAAAESDESRSSSALSSTALVFGDTVGVVMLTNTNANAARVLVAVRDLNESLVGCRVQVLAPNEQSVMFMKQTRSDATVVDGILHVQAYAYSAKKPLYAAQQPIDGLQGSLALVTASTGQVADVSDMLASTATSVDRLKDLDACLALGSGGSLSADGNALSETAPTSLARAAAPSQKSAKNNTKKR